MWVPTLLAKITTYKRTHNPLAFEWLVYRNDNEKILRLLSVVPNNGKILDIGCGSSRYWSLRPDLEWVGLDVNPEANADIVISPDETYPLGDESQDAVLMSFSIEHISNLNLLVKEINRVLKPNGIILIRCPFLYPLHDTPGDFYRFSSEGLDVVFSDFTQISKSTSGNYFGSSAVNRNYFLSKFYENALEGRKVKWLRAFLFLPILLAIFVGNVLSLTMTPFDRIGKFPVFLDLSYMKMSIQENSAQL